MKLRQQVTVFTPKAGQSNKVAIFCVETKKCVLIQIWKNLTWHGLSDMQEKVTYVPDQNLALPHGPCIFFKVANLISNALPLKKTPALVRQASCM